jgi:hypothetical protein
MRKELQEFRSEWPPPKDGAKLEDGRARLRPNRVLRVARALRVNPFLLRQRSSLWDEAGNRSASLVVEQTENENDDEDDCQGIERSLRVNDEG